MKKILIAFFTIISVLAYGQNDSSYCKHYISLNLTELLLVNPRISYEYSLNSRYSIKTEFGVKFRIIPYSQFSGYYSPFDGTYNIFQVNPYSYNNFSLSVGYNYFFKSKKVRNQHYFSGMFVYKYDFCKNIVLVGGEDCDYSYSLFSGKQNFYELKLVIGHRYIKLEKQKTSSSFIEFYTGVGISEKCGESTNKGTIMGQNPTPKASQINFSHAETNIIYSDNVSPRIYFGFIYGIAWKKKN